MDVLLFFFSYFVLPHSFIVLSSPQSSLPFSLISLPLFYHSTHPIITLPFSYLYFFSRNFFSLCPTKLFLSHSTFFLLMIAYPAHSSLKIFLELPSLFLVALLWFSKSFGDFPTTLPEISLVLWLPLFHFLDQLFFLPWPPSSYQYLAFLNPSYFTYNAGVVQELRGTWFYIWISHKQNRTLALTSYRMRLHCWAL